VATSSALSTRDVLTTIVRVVSPYLGETMARSAAQAHCQKLGIGAERMLPKDVEALITRMASGLNVFVGREKSSAIVAELRQAIAGQGAAS
jgi:hypothetical protein